MRKAIVSILINLQKSIVPEETTSPLASALSKLWAVIEDLPYTTFCAISAVISFIVTVVFLLNWFKRDRNAEITTGDGDKKTDSKVHGGDTVSVGGGIDGGNLETSDGQDGSEEDLPWILRKAPSDNSLSDGKDNSTSEDKLSENSESEKSQNFAKHRKSAAGDREGAIKGVKTLTADGEYVSHEE